MKRVRAIFKKLKSLIKPKSEDLTYDEFIRLEGTKFPGVQKQERIRPVYIRDLDL